MKDRLLVSFAFLNILIFCILFYLAYTYHNYKRSKLSKKKDSFKKWINQGDISFRGVMVSICFGFIFGFIDNLFLWIGTDFFEKYIHGDSMIKAGWGNTYSDFVGATMGTALTSILKNFLGYNNDNHLVTPIWIDAVSIPLGCIVGLYVGKTFIGNKK